MEKTNTFFVIHNFNTVPADLIEYTNNYVIYDCSSDEEVKKELRNKKYNLIEKENTGHNLTSYLDFIINNYDNLPDTMCFCKGNMIGRHCSKEYFDKVYLNKTFTFLYENKLDQKNYEKSDDESKSIAYLLTESMFIEKNDSWYMDENHDYKYFYDMDNFLKFIYKNPIIPQYMLFSPGGCYILTRQQILMHPKQFYENIAKLMLYKKDYNFPAEAFLVERILPMLFTSTEAVNDYMNEKEEFDNKLKLCEEATKEHKIYVQIKHKKIKKIFGLKEPQFEDVVFKK